MKEVKKIYNRLHKQLTAVLKDHSSFFSKPKPHVVKSLEPLLENAWPRFHWHNEHYIEGWPFRDLPQQSMAIGLALGKNPKKFKANEIKIKRLCNQLESFNVLLNDQGKKREIHLGLIIQIEATDKGSRIHTLHRVIETTLSLPALTKQLDTHCARLQKRLKKS